MRQVIRIKKEKKTRKTRRNEKREESSEVERWKLFKKEKTGGMKNILN